ncbi:hypothetical protein QFC19_008283 [Naganishia cerealis]|uniref:Uncharacterized protein n=1 Tax=Naganishia cerealis TaxID=610337 RepID=A0ACC2V3Y4_9TREE|nr:hypothetical protein QFC19_008283 [Naganishia cerealis]
MTEARSSDCEADTEDVDIEGNSQPVESLEEVSRMATQVSSTQGPMETAKGNEDHDEARAKINSEVPQREQQKTAPSKGAIDLEKLMNTIDMTRVSPPSQLAMINALYIFSLLTGDMIAYFRKSQCCSNGSPKPLYLHSDPAP